MPAALLHSHWRAQGPASADLGSRPVTSSAAFEEDVWIPAAMAWSSGCA